MKTNNIFSKAILSKKEVDSLEQAMANLENRDRNSGMWVYEKHEKITTAIGRYNAFASAGPVIHRLLNRRTGAAKVRGLKGLIKEMEATRRLLISFTKEFKY